MATSAQKLQTVIDEFPRVPALDFVPANDNRDPVSYVNREVKIFQRKFAGWKRDVSIVAQTVQTILEDAQRDNDDMPGAIRFVENILDFARQFIIDAPNVFPPSSKQKALLSQVAQLSEAHRKAAKLLLKYCTAMRDEYIETMEHLVERLDRLKWDHDPDARGGQPASDIESLLALLAS